MAKTKSIFRISKKIFSFLISSACSLPSLLKRLSSSLTATISLIVIVLWVLIAIFAPVLTPYPHTQFQFDTTFQAPTTSHFFGTDQYGRDVFSRVIMGSREIFKLALPATFLGLLVGIVIGLISGYYGGYFDEFIMRAMDIMMAFPGLLLALTIIALLGEGLTNVVIVIAIVFIPRIARLVRSGVLSVKSKEFVDAARVRGESTPYILAVEILPNMLGEIIVEGSVRFAYAIFIAASLSFLGIGIQPPSPDWGLLINEARGYIGIAPWTSIFPALSIASLIVAANFLSEGLQKIFEGEL